MTYQSIDTDRFHWCWKEFGHGPKLMLAFHGFNRSPDDFMPFGKDLGEYYTILAFDLFFHGKSFIKGQSRTPFFTLPELKEVIEKILSRYHVQEFELLAHSFGGRLAFNITGLFPGQVKGLYLMAPDALRFNPGYWFATQTWLGKTIMKRYKQTPGPILAFMRLLPKLGLYSEKAIVFYINQVTFGPVRERVYKVWMGHRKTVVKQNEISFLIKHHQIPFILFLGKFDSVIPSKAGEQLIKLSGSTARLIYLEVGHRVHEKHREICGIILGNRELIK